MYLKKIIHVFTLLSVIVLGPWACNNPTFSPTAPTLLPSIVSTLTPTATVNPPSQTPTFPSLNCGAPGVTPPQADNLLGGDLYPLLKGQSATGNIFYSPFSILVAMSMAQEGAANSTACQMQTALNLDPSASVRLPAFQQWIGAINNPAKHYILDTSDDLWIQNGFNVLPAYINALQTDYAAGVTNLNFQGDPGGSAQTIDGAVSQQTGGFIPNLLSPADIPVSTRVILTNAIYFKANWEYQFPVTGTKPQSFYMDNGGTESVSMMNAILPVSLGNYYNVAQVAALPYENMDTTMYVFLPPKGGTAALEAQMTGSNLNTWLNANGATMNPAGPASVSSFSPTISLPRFSFSTQYGLVSPFQQLGITWAFDMKSADFSNIDGLKDLHIGNVIHEAYVDVNESGTTAAAATAVIFPIYITAIIIPPSFIADHPFLFAIVENHTNAVLFMGRVDDPLSKK